MYDKEQAGIDAMSEKSIVVMIRYVAAKGALEILEMLSPTASIIGQGFGGWNAH